MPAPFLFAMNDFKPETSPDFSHGAYYQYARKEEFQKKDFDTFTERLNSLLKSIFKRKKNLVNNGTPFNKQKETDNINKPYDISGPDI